MVEALSRVPNANSNYVETSVNPDMDLIVISYPYFGWMDDIRRSSENDESIVEKI